MPAEDFQPLSPDATPADDGLPEITPDIVEQDSDDTIDDIIPSHGFGMIPVVGLGGSAGGLTALQEFFGAMPPKSGMAFVVILHLSPEHESILAELLQRTTTMEVRQVRGRVKVEPNCVYVIPPAKHLSVADGHLSLTEISHRSGKHVAVDLFFRTLADTHGPHAAAVVLSGADGDGAIGIKRVKERGGLTIVQDPNEAEHDGMPRSAIATDLVDWVLPAAEIPGRLVKYWEAERRLQLPPEQEEPSSTPEARPPPDRPQAAAEAALHDILGFLRVRTGHDFAYYKRATVLRRIARRMQVHGVEDPQAYLRFIRAHPSEPDALLRDLLISVTNFFRDRDAFTVLQAALPAIFRGKGPADSVRVWVAACATGEEAYSVAMLLKEYAATLEQPPTLQVFATDLDENAIQTAREGKYAETIAADVTETRLRRFFSKIHGGYRIKREVRDIVLFALHDLLKDSPFSRLDLVTCRNLLIYLNHDAQTRALEIFHFALRGEGTLFLGSSESVDENSPLFAVLDKKRRIYLRRNGSRSALPFTTERGPLLRKMLRQLPASGSGTADAPHAAGPVNRAAPRPSRAEAAEEAPTSWSDLHYELIEQLAPPSVVVNQDHQVMHVSENAGRFLQVGGGEPTVNLLRMVHPMLRIELRAALYRAAQTGGPVNTRGVSAEIEGTPKKINLRVVPSRSTHSRFLLVIFQEQEGGAVATPAAEPDAATRHLEEELEQTKAQLRNIIEQSEASDEELKASNEELQAINEELRSAGEELETGREELQSINEELSTVNQELKSKVDELAAANSDLQNLMASTNIATVFLDRDLCIQRYTPPAVALFNLIPTDVGRPLSDLTPRLSYPDLSADATRVLTDLGVKEVEVADADGHFFLVRMLPYRTADDRIAGVVMTFVDITQRRYAGEELRGSEARFRAVSNLVPDLLFSTDAAGQLRWCNERWLDYTGQTVAQAQGNGWVDIVHPEDRERTRENFASAIAQGQPYKNELRLMRADGAARWFLVRAEPLRDADGQIVQWYGAKTDIDDFKRASSDLAVSEERLRLLVENAREFAIFSMDLELRITSWNPGAEHILGYTEREIHGQSADLIFNPEDRAKGAPQAEARQALAEARAVDERWHMRKDGSLFWASGALMVMRSPGGEAIGFVKILRDETEARQTREALEQSRQELLKALDETGHAYAAAEAASRAKDHFLAVLSHELRTPLTPVLMAVHMLGRNRELPADAREALEMIERNVQIEAHFIDDLLDITRISRGRLEIVPEPMDAHQAIRHAVSISAGDLEGREQRLTVVLDAGEYRLQGDATRLQQVFWNLLKNASKFTPDGGSIRIVSRNEPGWLVVEVSDTGIGFAPEAAARIFDAFIQADAEITRQFGGLGLGLAISKATVDAHGGTLQALSEGKNRGANFIVSLPLPEASEVGG